MSKEDKNIAIAINYYQNNFKNLYDEFISFLRIPSVSTSKTHKQDIHDAANFLVKKLTNIGLSNVIKIPTPQHPVVFGEMIVDPDKPTVLIYGHYDVQPPDPIDEWRSAPFEPEEHGEHLYARGASDMKGQIWATISALQAIIEVGKLGGNIKILFEGEEEIGSPSLDGFLKKYRSLFASDFVLNPDGGMIAPGKPTIIYALRGLAYFELRLYGPKTDLHSGIFGGVVGNPANILCDIIAGMHDQQGKVTLPNFYSNVREMSDLEKVELSRIGLDEEFYTEITGAPKLSGEEGYAPVERTGARPTLDVNGLYAGYIGKGAKTIIPAYAVAKISTRLVPDQDPEAVHDSLTTYLQEFVPETVTWELNYMSGAPAYINESDTPGLDIFSDALKKTWGVKPLMKREGGSIPVTTAIKEILGINSIISGFGLPDDQIHSPNERLHLPTHQKGVEALIRFFTWLS